MTDIRDKSFLISYHPNHIDFMKRMEKDNTDLLKHYDLSHNLMNRADSGILAKYKESHSYEFNKALYDRSKTTGEDDVGYQEHIPGPKGPIDPIRIRQIDYFTRHQHQTPKDLVLYHGTRRNPLLDMDSQRHLKLPAFTSTSLDPSEAYHHTQQKATTSTTHGSDFPHILRIKWPKGSGGSYVDSLLGTHKTHLREHEMLLPRNVTFKISETPQKVYHKGKHVSIWDAEAVSGHVHQTKPAFYRDFW